MAAQHDSRSPTSDEVKAVVANLQSLGGEDKRDEGLKAFRGLPAAGQAQVIDSLESAIKQPLPQDDPMEHWPAIEALGAVGPEAGAAIPLLRDCLKNDEHYADRIEAAAALSRIEPEKTDDFLEWLLKALDNETLINGRWMQGGQSNDPEVAASALGDLGPAGRVAVSALARMAKTPGYQQIAAEALRKINGGRIQASPEADASKLLAEIREGLAQIRSVPLNMPTDETTELNIANRANLLFEAGDPRGVEAVCDFFEGSQWPFRDATWFSHLGLSLKDDHLERLMVNALEHAGADTIGTACNYYDVRYPAVNGLRYSAKAAGLIIKAMNRTAPKYFSLEECSTAFKGQLANPEVKKQFFATVYPTLSGAERDIANGLLR